MSSEFLNTVAIPIIIASLLFGGLSLAFLFIKGDKKKFHKYLYRFVILSISSFVLAIISMASIFVKTNNGYRINIDLHDLMIPRLIGAISFSLGLFSIISIIILLVKKNQ